MAGVKESMRASAQIFKTKTKRLKLIKRGRVYLIIFTNRCSLNQFEHSILHCDVDLLLRCAVIESF